MILEAGNKLVMIGDSVTDCGRKQPVGEGLFEALGNGYVSLVQASLLSKYPQLGIRIVNMGISGNTVRDLKQRWKTDVLDLTPDWLSVMIGINDVWRQFDSTLQSELAVSLCEYKKTLDELVSLTKPKLKGLILMTPFYIEPNPDDRMRSMMDQYGNAVKEIAQKYQTLFVDTQAAFRMILEHYHSSFIAWDRVHPNNIGHMILAQAFLSEIGAS